MIKNTNRFLLFFFLLSIYSLKSQVTSIPLQYDVSGYKENQANSQSSLNSSNIDYTLIPAVKAEMTVNEAGALDYVIPIECFKGVNNFQPNISLAYNSQSGNGSAGWGWNIVGISVISQGGKSKEVDGITIGSQFDSTDPYYLDGQRLLKRSDTEYVTQKFSKLKITKSSGTYSFTIQYTDGKIAQYKELVNGQHYIVRIVDAFNNEIHYSYSVADNNAKLDKVSYGGNDVSTDKFYININYIARKFPIKIYRNAQQYINTKIISEIKTGSTYTGEYRKYSLAFDYIEANSTERLRTVTVYNESGESLKPLNFNYNSVSQGEVTKSIKPGNSLDWGTKGLGNVAVGNFSGSGTLEAIYQRKYDDGYALEHNMNYIIPAIVVHNEKTDFFSGKSLINGIISERDQLIIVNTNHLGTPNYEFPNNPSNDNLIDEITFTSYDIKSNTSKNIKVSLKGTLIDKSYVEYEEDPYRYSSPTPTTIYNYIRSDEGRSFISGDFNNDGLIDFIVKEESDLNRGNRIYFLEIGKATQDITNPVILSETTSLTNFTIYPIELDGDGMSELMALNKSNGNYDVYKINLSTSSISKIVDNQILSNYTSDTPLFFGDFNGDGLTDFLTPQKVYKIEDSTEPFGDIRVAYKNMETQQLLWWKYTSDGQKFIKNEENYTQQKIAYLKTSQTSQYSLVVKGSFWQKLWNAKNTNEYQETYYVTHNIIISDFNGDGRSDIISLNKFGKTKYRQDGNIANIPVENMSDNLGHTNFPVNQPDFISTMSNRINFYENRNLSGGTFEKITETSIIDTQISPLSIIIPSSDFNQLNTYKTGFFIHDSVTGNNIDIKVNNDNFIEKQIQEVNNGSTVLQRIEYRPLSKLQTKEELCYQFINTNLQYPLYTHQNNGSYYLAHKIHTLFSGKILTKEYRYENAIQHLEGKGFLGFQKTYVSDAYESSLTDGKYRSKNPKKAVFWTINTKDPLMENNLWMTSYGGINKFITTTTFLNKKYLIGGDQYIILATDEVTNDNLRKFSISKKYIYDENDDAKLKKVYTDYNGEATNEASFTYQPEFSNGQHYFYGKIAEQNNINYKDGLTFKTKEVSEYFSENGSIKETKKYSQDSPQWVSTSFKYFPNGNLKEETLSTPGIASQTKQYGYESTDRYVNSTTTPDGLITTSIIDALGRASEETSAIGNLKTYYSYDNWGNITAITDYLGKVTNISKTISNSIPSAIYQLSKKREGGTETIVVFDEFDREILSKTQSINNKWVVTKTEYDLFGRKVKQSQPFFEGEAVKWNTVEYDNYNRPVKNITYTGKVITTCYEGLKVTVDDGYKKTSKTLNATGNTIRFQDHGGVINYKYYPNGSLKESNYEGSKITFEIDDWGNKKKMVDPSSGTFTYEYDNFGRLTKEVNPKGYTLFTYDDLGRPYQEKTYGNTPAENTTIEKTYTYNGQTKLPETITGVSNGKTFTYTTYYDNYYRIKGKKEETPDFTYSSNTSFDPYGNPDETTITTTLLNPNYTTSSKIKNSYDSNGILIQQNDVLANKTIWHISNANAMGNSTQMEYGNGFVINSYYSTQDNSLQKTTHSNGSVTALDIDYVFDVNKGVLNSRNNNTFSKQESFTYDTLNRLLKETVNGTTTNEYSYDQRGRMTGNTELGQYNYNGNDYKLQNIAFNSNGQQVNNTRGFAEVKYNAFKSPLQIQLAGKDNLKFEYNLLKTRYRMYSEVTGKQKLYSSDFAVEIAKDNTGKTEIITYITGDPYSANYIEKVILNGSSVIEKANYFLHRDHLSSILAITKASDGAIVEKRFFDAWGNLKGLVNSSGQLITDNQQLANANLFIDRGYTGHEHLMSVGLINMNARLYDPIIRRFLSTDNYIQVLSIPKIIIDMGTS